MGSTMFLPFRAIRIKMKRYLHWRLWASLASRLEKVCDKILKEQPEASVEEIIKQALKNL